jgi:chemotaxis protein histidine kinase CheA
MASRMIRDIQSLGVIEKAKNNSSGEIVEMVFASGFSQFQRYGSVARVN